MSFTFNYLEYAFLVFVRIASIVMIAPFFSNTQVPIKVKAGISLFLSLIVMNLVDYTAVSYDGLLGYSILVLKEAITGVLIGIGSAVCLYILSFSGHMVDMEIGFSMAMEFDPTTQVQTTISSTLFSSLFMLLFLASDMHYYIIDALFDSYELIPIGGATFSASLYQIFVKYVTDYFVIGFRIILPVFACTLILNVILGILAKVAPQMNMFVIGMQLKVFVGLVLLFLIMSLLPGITDFLFEEMQVLTKLFMQSMAP
ncbi:MAG: flagellar biosynthetic protein FliR [Butyribacter sp.]|nr:flagellar biosynthetic protein FliR [bacterium]MDY3855250.1 flagellar biosynthetic protein FliR [Butyribacter sp.]